MREDAATRHLCAGVYLDPAFRRVVLRQVHNDTTRMVAPSYGFDLVPVVRHAWKSWGLEMGQHVCVLAVFGTGFMVNPPAILAVASGLGLWHLSRLMVRSAVAVLPLRSKEAMDRLLWRTRWRRESDELRQQTRLLQLSGVGCGALIAAPPLIAGISQTSLDEMATAALLFTLLIVLAVAGRGAIHQLCLNRMHGTGPLRPRKLTRREQTINDQQSHPYVVYRRPLPQETEKSKEDLDFDLLDSKTSPFIGSGKLIHRWIPPLTIQLLSSEGGPDTSMEERERMAPPFKARELVAHLKEAMGAMGDVSDPTRLRGFDRNDRLYIAEADVPPDPEWLRERPDRDDIGRIVDDPHGIAHHFLEIRTSVTGEVMTTVFLRVSIKGRALSLDFAACALTRTPAEYHLLNAFKENDRSAVLRSAFRGLRNLPAGVAEVRNLVEAPSFLIGAALARRNRLLVPRRGAAIGAQLSIREEKSVPWNQAQLDKATIYDYMKLIEQRLLKAAEEFLELKKLDTSAFNKKATSIVNMGVLSMGGKIEMKQSAVGANAQVRPDTRESDDSHGDSPME
ncbi:hypothetical protein [Streptosporangium roseum]|uniref:Uncharacterized protein n=1 Tax=Streptosporangium roseum (strain ATCC 12428 / DSM 43021 / JCM 3005 / KCTC 9067 / NCIMB 10171 / NRRL 2505 / NI 9100) TaxID=479432 RepID=D2BFS8_STRRD|nr:hypothetical protein [Streptosporangium roseum]ACZ90239.1 hypothetical protein Sros_7560 [Streptosporangium roseum DSM 43021]